MLASTFDDFTAAVAEEVDAGRHFLPVVTAELADTWIYGVPRHVFFASVRVCARVYVWICVTAPSAPPPRFPSNRSSLVMSLPHYDSDPQKVARARVLNRAWAAEKARRLQLDATTLWTDAVAADPVLLNATRFALKFGEHTWGKDVKSNLKDNYNWLNDTVSAKTRTQTPHAKSNSLVHTQTHTSSRVSYWDAFLFPGVFAFQNWSFSQL